MDGMDGMDGMDDMDGMDGMNSADASGERRAGGSSGRSSGRSSSWPSVAGLSRDTVLLACASLLSDISTEMLYPVLPVFLTQVLGAPVNVVGLIEGLATAVQYLIQGISGWLSDRLQQIKTFALVGYILAALAKATIAVCTIWPEVLAARVVDRLGTGMRSAPRDALIAASTDAPHRGKAFGLEGLGDNLGAFLGPLVAALLLFAIHLDLRLIFALTLIPGVLAALVILPVATTRAHVKTAHSAADRSESGSHGTGPAARFPTVYWTYLGVTAIYALGNSTNAFLILWAKQIGVPLVVTIVIYAGFNLVAALASFPAGTLSDSLGRKRVLLLAFLVFVITYAGFAASAHPAVIAVLFILYGLHTGMYRAVGKALATDLAPAALRTTGIGWYSATIGLGELIASLIAGQLWIAIAPGAAFLYGAVLSALALLALQFLLHVPAQTTPRPQPTQPVE